LQYPVIFAKNNQLKMNRIDMDLWRASYEEDPFWRIEQSFAYVMW
jgi:hypothetical protein